MKSNKNRGDARLVIILSVVAVLVAVGGTLLAIRIIGDRKFTKGEIDENNVYVNRWADLRYEIPDGYKRQKRDDQWLFANSQNRAFSIMVEEEGTIDEAWESLKYVFQLMSSFGGSRVAVNVGGDTTEQIGGYDYKSCTASFTAAGQTYYMKIIGRQVRKKGVVAFCFLTPSKGEFDMFETNIRSYR